ncbi:restriction endonuclease [Desertibacillus haloalkaliphilus]|nr:restriction endonuclease [Desertibacillus haloalkaliphilus]
MVIIATVIGIIRDRLYHQRLLSSGILEVDKMNGRQFEEFLGAHFRDDGYHVKFTPKSRDYGADLIIKKRNEKIVVQAKRYKKNAVGIKAVQEVYAAKNYYNANHAWVITNNTFSSPAQKLAKKNGVKLIPRDQLIDLLNKKAS